MLKWGTSKSSARYRKVRVLASQAREVLRMNRGFGMRPVRAAPMKILW